MNLVMGQELKLKTGLSVTLVGQAQVVENNQQKQRIVGRLQDVKYIHENTLSVYHLFDVTDIEGVETQSPE